MANFADKKIPNKIARMVHADASTRKVLHSVKNEAMSNAYSERRGIQ